jgi:hypothetical protein
MVFWMNVEVVVLLILLSLIVSNVLSAKDFFANAHMVIKLVS